MERVYEAGKFAIYTSLGLGVLFYMIGMLFPEFLVSMFSRGDKELLEITVKGIKIYFLAFILMGINIVLTYYLQSKEYAKASMMISLLRGFVFTVVYVLVLSRTFGIIGVWMTLPFAELSTIILSVVLSLNCRKIIVYSIKNIGVKQKNVGDRYETKRQSYE